MKKVKLNKGFTQVDIIVSVFILMLFSSLIAALFYNSYNSSISNKRHAEATTYLTRILESIELINYDNLDGEVINVINNIDSEKLSGTFVENGIPQVDLTTPYKAEVEIVNYNEMPGNEDKKDLVKQINITIIYKTRNNKPEENISAKRLKSKEAIYEDSLEIIPNIYEGMIPISSETQLTNKFASNWFNYADKKVAKVMLGDANYNLDTGEITNIGSSFIYIPRFAYNIDENGNTNIKFLNSDDTCKDGSSTTIYKEEDTIDNSKYYLPSCFSQNNIQVQGLWIGEYLSKMNTEGNNGQQIYIGKKDEANNYKYWTDLTSDEKQTQCNYITSEDANYGLKGNGTAIVADESINKMLDILKNSEYSFISDEVKENENDYAGSFRVVLF